MNVPRIMAAGVVGLVVLSAVACSSGGGSGASGGGWCYTQANDSGTTIYAWPTQAYQPMAQSNCTQLASDLSSQAGYTFSVVASVPGSANAVCDGDFDNVTVSLADTSSSTPDACDALNFNAPVP